MFDNIRLLNILAIKWRVAVFVTRGKANVRNGIVHTSRKKPNRAKLSLDEILLSYRPTLFIQHTSYYRPINTNDYDKMLMFYIHINIRVLWTVFTLLYAEPIAEVSLCSSWKSQEVMCRTSSHEKAPVVCLAAGSGSFCGLCFCVKFIASDWRTHAVTILLSHWSGISHCRSIRSCRMKCLQCS